MNQNGTQEDQPGSQRENPPRREARSHYQWLPWVAAAVLAAIALAWLTSRSQLSRGKSVVVYCAQDETYAEPIFRDFTRQTGIEVRPIYDSEAVKTVGLANRLIEERNHPRCDVFWGNEEMRTRLLAAKSVFRETNGWAAFGARSRRIVLNTNLVAASSAPRSLLELTNSFWGGKVALAYPQFGTTATHLHALRQLWGENLWRAWCTALAANQPQMVDGNSVVVKQVGRGEAWLGLTDSDDIAAGQREGLPVAALPINGETLLIPNTVAVVRSSPSPAAAESLFRFLQSAPVIERLVSANALENAAQDSVRVPVLRVDWDALLGDLDNTTAELNRIFLR